jgi:hypothetical protein
MTHDFDISRLQGRWQAVATSRRGRAFAAEDPRFGSGKAELDPAQTLPIFQELYDKGYFPSAPDGLHPAGPGTIAPRLAILLAAGVVPLLVFAFLA